MSNGLLYSAVYNPYNNVLSLVDKTGQRLCSFTVPTGQPATDDPSKPLTLVAAQDGSTVSLSSYGTWTDFSYLVSYDEGETWETYTEGTDISLGAGDKVSFCRSDAAGQSSPTSQRWVQLHMTGRVSAYHNINSMCDRNFLTLQTIPSYAFFNLFKDCTVLVRPPLIAMPSSGLAYGGHQYESCFEGCTGLTESPVLPYSNVSGAPAVYRKIFYGCSSMSKITCMAANVMWQKNVSKENYTYPYTEYWVQGVASSGDFCYPATATPPDDQWTPNTGYPMSGGYGGVPSQWNRIDINV